MLSLMWSERALDVSTSSRLRFQALKNLACDVATLANHQALREVCVPNSCCTKEHTRALPCVSRQKPDSVVDYPAARVALAALPTSAYIAQLKTEDIRTVVQQNVSLYWLHLQDVCALGLSESQAK